MSNNTECLFCDTFCVVEIIFYFKILTCKNCDIEILL